MDYGFYRRSMHMKQATIQIATGKRQVEIQAYTDPTFPGLAIHRFVGVRSDGTTWTGQGWRVTHMQSGKLVITDQGYDLRRQAVSYARTLCRCLDCTKANPFAGLARGALNTAIYAAKGAATASK